LYIQYSNAIDDCKCSNADDATSDVTFVNSVSPQVVKQRFKQMRLPILSTTPAAETNPTMTPSSEGDPMPSTTTAAVLDGELECSGKANDRNCRETFGAAGGRDGSLFPW
jgi:hypothetical protein